MIDDRYDDEEDSLWRRHGPVIGAVVGVLISGGGLYAFFSSIGGTQAPQVPEVQQISLVQPPPPPPPPPPPQMEQPPPEMEEVEIPEPEPEPIADDAPADEPLPGDDLGLDADGVAGSDGFGLKAKKGGRSLIGGGDRNKWYAGVIQNELQSVLAGIDDIRRGRYAFTVRIWIDGEGRVENAEVVRGTGDSELDQALQQALISGTKLSHAPPEDLPQPVRLRISSRT